MRRVLTIILTGVAVLAVAELFGPGGRQRRAAGHMHAFTAKVLPLVQADPRFASVDVGSMTHPSLRVTGAVPDDKSLADLKAILTPPPGADFWTRFEVSVGPPPATRPAR